MLFIPIIIFGPVSQLSHSIPSIPLVIVITDLVPLVSCLRLIVIIHYPNIHYTLY